MSYPRYRIFCLLVFQFAMSAGFSQEKTSSQAFNWPVPSRVKVFERALKNGQSVEMSYFVTIDRWGANQYIVKMTDFDFIRLNDEVISKEDKDRVEIQNAINLYNATPAMIINAEGRLITLRGVEDLIQSSVQVINSIRSDDSGKELGEARKRDSAEEFLLRRYADYWAGWVEGWIDFPVLPGGAAFVKESEGALFSNTDPVKMKKRFQHLGDVPGSRHLVHLRIQTILDATTYTVSKKQMLRHIDNLGGKPADPEIESIPNMVQYSDVESKIDPKTLQPFWIKNTTIIQPASDKPEEDEIQYMESREYTFDWNWQNAIHEDKESPAASSDAP